MLSCTRPIEGNSIPTSSGNVIFTAAARTVEAELTQVAVNSKPSPSPVNLLPGETTLPLISPTAPPNQTTPVSESDTPCNRGKFVKDISVPDGTRFESGEVFVKTWLLENTGSCTWTSSYSVVFDSSDSMGGPASFSLTESSVPPGEEVEVSVSLTAPTENGTYRGNWKLRDPSGKIFGLGSKGNAPFWVEITVGEPPDFSLAFDNIHECDGTPHAIFRLTNTGSTSFESGEISFTDLETGEVIFGPLAHNGPFMGGPDHCPQGADAVVPGKTAYIGGNLGDPPPSDHSLRITVEICTKNDMAGVCNEKSITFVVP